MPSGSSGRLSNRPACSDASDTEGTLHRKGIGPDAGFDAGPGNRRGDWKPFTHTRRVGADGSSAAAVPQVVEEYPAAPVSLRREHIVLRILLRESPNQVAGIAVHLVMQDRFR